MSKRFAFIWIFVEHILPWLTLAILGIFTFAKFFVLPYSGFIFFSSNAEIRMVFVENPSNDNLIAGDRLLQIGNIEWDEFQNNLFTTLLDGYSPGEDVTIKINRDGQVIDILWTLPGWNRPEFLDRFGTVLVLAYLFWASSLITSHFVRPKDDRWLLMIAFFSLTALWLAAGSLSAWHIWGSAMFLRVIIWICIPLYLHLHWNIPRPFKNLHKNVIAAGYGMGVLLSILQIFQLLPEKLYYLGFLAAVFGSLLFSIAHVILQKDIRKEFLPILGATAITLIPITLITISGLSKSTHTQYYWGYMAMPILPAMYFLGAFRKRLAGLEIRVNRIFTNYVFIILLSAFAVILIFLDTAWGSTIDLSRVFNFFAYLLIGITSIILYPRLVRLFEKHFWGIPVSSSKLLKKYTERVSSNLDFEHLSLVLQGELLPSLLIRQSALLRVDNHSITPVFLINVENFQIPEFSSLPEMLNEANLYRYPHKEAIHPWVRLILPLSVEGKLLGVWLLGRRDPDDFYSTIEIDLLKTIANQTAITMANILSKERILSLYQENILRHETERKKLAHDLHDDILSSLAVLGMLADDDLISSEFQKEYESLIFRIRKIISGLRPAMLDYGLYQAIEELIQDLTDRSSSNLTINFSIQSSNISYESSLEGHIYRIIQQALENAFQHAKARHISVSGELLENRIFLLIEDDGIGFNVQNSSEKSQSSGDKHFGLVMMHERAEIIGAQLEIESSPNTGTRVSLVLPDVLQKQSQYTARIAAENALFKSEKKLNTLMNATPDIIFLIDTEGNIVSFWCETRQVDAFA